MSVIEGLVVVAVGGLGLGIGLAIGLGFLSGLRRRLDGNPVHRK